MCFQLAKLKDVYTSGFYGDPSHEDEQNSDMVLGETKYNLGCTFSATTMSEFTQPKLYEQNFKLISSCFSKKSYSTCSLCRAKCDFKIKSA